MHALVPRPALVQGTREVLHEFEDTYTHPEYRGQGIFTAITERLLAQSGGLAFVVPNENARPLWERKFGFRSVQRLVDLRVKFPSLLRGVSRRTGIGASEGWPRRVVSKPPDGALPWEGAAEAIPRLCDPGPASVRFLREADFLRWRYALCPLPHAVHLLGDRGWGAWLPTELEGYRRLYTLDLGCTEEEEERHRLAASIVDWARDAGADELRVLVPVGDPWESALRAVGAKEAGPPISVYASPELALRAGDGRWWMRLADTGDM